jgi:hypothetical protein
VGAHSESRTFSASNHLDDLRAFLRSRMLRRYFVPPQFRGSPNGLLSRPALKRVQRRTIRLTERLNKVRIWLEFLFRTRPKMLILGPYWWNYSGSMT